MSATQYPPVTVPWARPPVGEDEADAAREAIAATRLSMGRSVREFEAALMDYTGRAHAIAVSNGTDALEVAMRLLGVGAGDEVLVSALSYIATVNCIVRTGARPVWCDVDPRTLNIDPAEVARRITPATRALVTADYCGFCIDYAPIERTLAEHGVPLLVDGAQSLGTFHGARSALALGRVSTTSFHSAKIITTGEGGMVFVDDDELAERARRYRGQGEVPARKYVHDTLGFNHRITDFQGAIGVVQARRLPDLCARRRAAADSYYRLLEQVEGVTLLDPLPGTTPAWFSLPILVDDRDRLAHELRMEGIETRSLYPIPTYRQAIPEYGHPPQPLPGAEETSARVLNLPLFAQITDDDIQRVVGGVRAHVGAGG
ncbi:MAG: DegT/DnrJ/EryC1/StrS family aminotransferase [Thermoleophilia bacterium]|nr:DegT/DnrJ/EryC1/StrS family aminotransferase [Thermoleophilia bacterium]